MPQVADVVPFPEYPPLALPKQWLLAHYSAAEGVEANDKNEVTLWKDLSGNGHDLKPFNAPRVTPAILRLVGGKVEVTSDYKFFNRRPTKPTAIGVGRMFLNKNGKLDIYSFGLKGEIMEIRVCRPYLPFGYLALLKNQRDCWRKDVSGMKGLSDGAKNACGHANVILSTVTARYGVDRP
jgi:hypothetical protein